jgi:hypothetical protein
MRRLLIIGTTPSELEGLDKRHNGQDYLQMIYWRTNIHCFSHFKNKFRLITKSFIDKLNYYTFAIDIMVKVMKYYCYYS